LSGFFIKNFSSVILLFIISPSFVQAEAFPQKEWKNALFYFSVGSKKSLVSKESSFFLSPQGNKDPQAELQENLKLLMENNDESRTYQCRFPFRYQFLKKYFPIKEFTAKCPDLDLWRSQLRAKSISLVFPTQYASNPASVMGHTFLKFENPLKPDLLNPIVNYSATIDQSTSFASYALKGLFGGFNGQFQKVPFYQKTIEYGDFEQRDIWVYDLIFSKNEREKIIDIIWELKNEAKIPYYFLRENCSFIPLTLLEIIRPDISFTSQFNFYVAPYMTIQKLEQLGFIKKSHFRPSLKRVFLDQLQSLNKKEKSLFFKTLENEKVYRGGHPYYETLMSYILYKEKSDKKLSDKWVQLLSEISVLRSKKEKSDDPQKIEPFITHTLPNPIQAHRPFHLELHQGYITNRKSYSLLRFRPGVHDSMDSSVGFLPHSSFSFFETDLGYFYQKKALELNHFRLINFKNLRIYQKIDPAISWKAKVEMRRQDIFCLGCQVKDIQFQMGIASKIAGELIYQLTAGLNQGFSKGYKKGYATFGLLELDLIQEWRKLKIKLSQRLFQSVIRKHSPSKIESDLRLRLYNVGKNLSLSASIKYQKILNREKKDLVDNNMGIIYDF